MPLKHHTETAYVLLLAAVIVCTGIFLSWLPPLPEGGLGWLLMLVVTGIYPLLLAPTLKINRADYEFRWLHVFPFVMVLLWGLMAFGLKYMGWALLLFPFAFVWSLPFVALGFILLGIFCVAVVRRSHVRLRWLSGLFAVYLLVGGFAYLLDWNSEVRAALFDGTPLGENVVTAFLSGENGTGTIAMVDPTESSSSSAASAASSKPAKPSKTTKPTKNQSSSKAVSSVKDVPKLPKSGGELGFLALTFVGGYFGALHRRSQVRA